MRTPPTELTLHQASRVLEIKFADAGPWHLPCEYLRVFSPSAEVRGHGGPMLTVGGKRGVNIVAIEPVGHYAVRLVFDDGHDTGLYGWDTLHELGENFAAYWDDYLNRLTQAGLSRDAAPPLTEHSQAGCS